MCGVAILNRGDNLAYRRCGLVVCDKCSKARRVMLPFSHIVQDPTVPLEQQYILSLQPPRVCDGCFEVLSRPRGSSRASSVMRRTPSAQSVMLECPVCGEDLEAGGGGGSSSSNSNSEQEQHVQTCLNANAPAALSGIRYVGKQTACKGSDGCFSDSLRLSLQARGQLGADRAGVCDLPRGVRPR